MQTTITLQQFGVSLRGRAKRTTDLTLPLKAGAIKLTGDIRKRFELSHGPNGKAWLPLKRPRISGPGKPLLDTGLLRTSIHTVSDGNSITAGTALRHARLHQLGGIVRPRGKYLVIPLTAAAKYAGSPRKMSGLTPRIGRRGGVMLDGAGVAQFALVRQVKIPARPFLGWDKAYLEWLKKVIRGYVLTGRL